MALAITLLVEGNSGATGAASYTTASISPTAGGAVIAFVAFRSDDLADITGEVAQIVGNDLTWTPIRELGYDSSTRMIITAFKGTGTPAAGTCALSCVSGRLLSRGIWVFCQITGQGSNVVVQSADSDAHTGAANTSLDFTLSAFGSASNFTLIGSTTSYSADSDFTKDTDYVDLTADMTQVIRWAGYLPTSDTSPLCTVDSTDVLAGIAMEIEALAVTGSPDASAATRGLSLGLRRGLTQ